MTGIVQHLCVFRQNHFGRIDEIAVLKVSGQYSTLHQIKKGCIPTANALLVGS